MLKDTNPTGRPTKMTDEVVMKLEQAFAIDASVGEACSYADISRNTFYVWLKENPDFQDRIDELRERPILKARQTIVKGLDNVQGAQWYLERKKKLEFAQRSELTGKDGGAIEIDDKTKQTSDNLIRGYLATTSDTKPVE